MAYEPTAPEPEPAAASPLRLVLRKLGFTLGALLVAWLLVTQVAARFIFSPDVNPAPAAPSLLLQTPAADPSIAVLAERIDKLEAKLKVLEEMALAPAPPAQSFTTPATEHAPAIDAASVDRLEQTLAKQEAELKTLHEKLETVASRSDDRLLILSSFMQFKNAFLQGAAFTAPLRQMEELFDGDTSKLQLLDEFAPYAQTGAPTLAALQTDFQQNIASIFTSEAAEHSWLRSLRSLVTIRKIGAKHSGGDDESIIARAEALLNEGQVSGALQELASLTPPARATLSPWLSKAESYLSLRQSLDQLELAVSRAGE